MNEEDRNRELIKVANQIIDITDTEIKKLELLLAEKIFIRSRLEWAITQDEEDLIKKKKRRDSGV